MLHAKYCLCQNNLHTLLSFIITLKRYTDAATNNHPVDKKKVIFNPPTTHHAFIPTQNTQK